MADNTVYGSLDLSPRWILRRQDRDRVVAEDHGTLRDTMVLMGVVNPIEARLWRGQRQPDEGGGPKGERRQRNPSADGSLATR